MRVGRESDDPTKKMGLSMIIAMWLIIFLMLAWFFSEVLDRQNNPNQAVVTQFTADNVKEVVLQRNRFGHYVTNGEINGVQVEFMLDTGATGVVVPVELAKKLSLKKGLPITVQTANGTVNAYAIKLDRVAIGEISLPEVKAILNPADQSGVVLLGMSFLKHIEFTQRGDTLILRQIPGEF